MTESVNVPYQKKYDDKGVIINPIKGMYLPRGPNRHARRMSDGRFMTNRKCVQIIVLGAKKYRKFLQIFRKKDGSTGVIKHYLEN